MTKQEREQMLKEKLIAMKAFDGEFSSSDEVYVAGIDEAGRGPLAGPVVAACVVLTKDFSILGVDDSKKISEKKRNQLFDEINEHALAVGVGIADNHLIDEINILQATKSAMKLAFEQANSILKEKTGMSIGHLLIDAVELKDINIPQSAVIKGDAKSLSIAAASIIAKVTRDKIMLKYHEKYPYYAFDSNKGYGTKAHYEGIVSHGITDIHRKTFLKNI